VLSKRPEIVDPAEAEEIGGEESGDSAEGLSVFEPVNPNQAEDLYQLSESGVVDLAFVC